MFRKLFLVLCICILPISVYAEDFSIGEPFFTMTEDLFAQGKTQAIKHAAELLHNPGDVIVGNPDGKITLVQFLDFECPLSEKMDPAIQDLVEGNPDLRIVYKPYPIHGKMSEDAAEAALSAFAQGHYQEYHVALMKQKGNLSDAKIIALARDAELNSQQIQQAITTKSYLTQIIAAKKLAKAIGVPGTPALFFMKSNTTSSSKPSDVIYMLGNIPEEDLQAAFDKLMK